MNIQSTTFGKTNSDFWLNNRPNQASPISVPKCESDSVNFTSGLSEDLVINKEKSIAGPIFDGKLNDKQTSIKVISDNDITYMEGLIGDKKLCLQSENDHYVGEYNGEKVEMFIDYEKPSKLSKFYHTTILGQAYRPDYFNIQGKIGDKELKLALPNIDVPKDEDVRDLLAIALFDNGLQARTYNGKIVSMYHSELAKVKWKKHQQQRNKLIDENVKPLISQGISTATGIIIGSLSTALVGKFLKK